MSPIRRWFLRLVRRRTHAVAPHRPWLETLEDRLTPAVTLTYGGTGTALTLSESVSGADNVTISELSATQLQINLNGNTFAAASTVAASGLTYSVPGNPTASTSAVVDISKANNITTLSSTLTGDFLSLGPVSDANGGIGNLNLAAHFIFVPMGDTISTVKATTGNGNITLTAQTQVQLNSGSSLLAGDGNITVKANQGGASGNFIAIGV